MVKAIKIFVLFAAAAGLIAASGYPKKLNNKAIEESLTVSVKLLKYHRGINAQLQSPLVVLTGI